MASFHLIPSTEKESMLPAFDSIRPHSVRHNHYNWSAHIDGVWIDGYLDGDTGENRLVVAELPSGVLLKVEIPFILG